MEGAIVCAAKQFIGFELCKELLNCGFNVMAIDNEKYLESIHFEKWLEIGRNANVSCLSIQELQDQIENKVVCYIPFVDFLGINDLNKMNDWLNIIESLIQNDKISKYIIILPTQFLNSSTEKRNDVKDLYKTFLNKVENKKLIEIYVPTLYGPWQPNTYLFQQLIEGKQKENYVDDPNDVIYIEDAVKEIVNYVHNEMKDDKIILKNEQLNLWKKCILFLKESFLLPEVKEFSHDFHIQSRIVQEKLNYEDGLTLQTEYFKRLQ